MNRPAALIICLVLSGLMAWGASRAPSPTPERAGRFSAQEAMADVRAIGARAHPIGSAEHDRVRDYVLRRFTQVGLETSLWQGRSFERLEGESGEAFIEGGAVQDIVAVLPGRSHELPALMVMAHYDSVPSSPGAADDGVGVAAALGIARALKDPGVEDPPVTAVTQAPPTRDVIFLITDGEEAGLLGARAFFADNPLARHVGAVLNMESRGGGGRAYMFETGRDAGGMIGLLRRTAVHPTASSLSSYIYAHMPNDTDFTVSRRLGLAGLNYAFIGRPFDYHAASSTPAATDEGSLQHMGEQVLSAASALAHAPALPAKGPDVVYDDLLGGPLIVYPVWAGWLVVAAAGGLAAAAFIRAFRREPFSLVDALRGAGGLVLAAAASGFALWLTRRLTGVPLGFVEEKALLARWELYESALAAVGLGATALAFKAVGLGRTRVWSAWSGALVLGLVLAVALQAAAPLVAFLLAWPLLAAAVLAAALAFRWDGHVERRSALAFLALAAAPALAQLLYLGHAVALGVGAELPEALAVFIALALVFGFPLVWPRGGERWPWALGAAALAFGLGLALFIRFADPWSARHPRPSEILYVADLDHRQYWRASPLPGLDAWTAAVLRADGGAIGRASLPPAAASAHAAPARPIAIAAPQVSVTRGQDGRTILRITPSGTARQVRIDVRAPERLRSLTINGLAAQPSPRPGQWTHIAWDADPAGLIVAFRSPAGPFEARWGQVTDGWPSDARPLPGRPAEVMPWMDSDTTMLIGSVR